MITQSRTDIDKEARRLFSLFKSIEVGEPWHGPALKDILQGISAEQAASRPIPNGHNIWELVLHMMSWRDYAWRKLNGEDDYHLDEESRNNWPPVTDTSEESWNRLISLFDQMSQLLYNSLREITDSKLKTIVPGKDYSFYFLLNGLIQHDIYHSGQISLLKKALN